MLARPHLKGATAPTPTPSVVPPPSAPETGATTFHVTAGVLTVDPLIGAPFALAFSPHPRSSVSHFPVGDGADPTITIRFNEGEIAPEHDTMIEAVHLTTYDVDFLRATYEVEVGLSGREEPIPDHSGTLTETSTPGLHVVEQDIALQIVVSTVKRSTTGSEVHCAHVGLSAVFDLALSLTGSYFGTIAPTAGRAVVDGRGTLQVRKQPESDLLFRRLFHDRPVTVTGLTLEAQR